MTTEFITTVTTTVTTTTAKTPLLRVLFKEVGITEQQLRDLAVFMWIMPDSYADDVLRWLDAERLAPNEKDERKRDAIVNEFYATRDLQKVSYDRLMQIFALLHDEDSQMRFSNTM